MCILNYTMANSRVKLYPCQLLKACTTGQLVIVSWLMENTSLRDNEYQEQNEALLEASKKGQQVRDVVEWMVKHCVRRALPDSRHVLGEAVWLVCSNAEFDMARWMVENAPGTNVNFIPDYSDGNTIMHRAIWCVEREVIPHCAQRVVREVMKRKCRNLQKTVQRSTRRTMKVIHRFTVPVAHLALTKFSD
jgi:hypothetical protein